MKKLDNVIKDLTVDKGKLVEKQGRKAIGAKVLKYYASQLPK
jgi:hypothetical protein